MLATGTLALNADPLGTAFTYQGNLRINAAAATGVYDFTFNLYATNSSGTPLGMPVVVSGVGITNGLFNTVLDFGSQFNGTATWLEIGVRSNNSGTFVTLAPRQPLTPTPNAIFAMTAASSATASNVTAGSITSASIADAAITSAKIGSGQVVKSLNGLQDAVTLAPGNNVTITPSGNTLTIAATTGGQNWSLNGNAGTTAGVNFLGTTDYQPLELWVNNVRAMRLEPAFGSPNFIAGASGNIAFSGAEADAIGGGNQNTMQSSTFGCVIGGGNGNNISGSFYSFIGGGQFNTNTGSYASIPGGDQNVAGPHSFAGGHRAKSVNTGSFVWADSQEADFSSTSDNEVYFRCKNGVFFADASGGASHVVTWNPGTASWQFASDRNLKDHIAAVDTDLVLNNLRQLPLAEWNYIGFKQRHIGPMAQDFHRVFPFNDQDKMLNDADLHGVALAAIQGLDKRVERLAREKDAEIANLKRQNESLAERLANLEDKLRFLTETNFSGPGTVPQSLPSR